jgi:shikimate dehydrogenase
VGEPRIGGATRVAAVLGWPVAHSLSPVIHNAAFDALEMDWTYVALPVQPGDVPAAVAGLRALGFAGANVTMPHKEAVAAVMDELADDADRLQAVNTIEMGADRLVGHNTDAPGFARFLERDAGFDPAGKTALVFGAGGAARACALAAARAGLTRIVVALREPARAAPVAAALDGLATEVEAIAFDDAADLSADLVVNATPLERTGRRSPCPSSDRTDCSSTCSTVRR